MSSEEYGASEEQKEDVAGWAGQLAKGFSWMYQRSLLRPNDNWKTFDDLLMHIGEMLEKREGESFSLSSLRRLVPLDRVSFSRDRR